MDEGKQSVGDSVAAVSRNPIEGPLSWTAAEVADPAQWSLRLTESMVRNIEEVSVSLRTCSKTLTYVEPGDFDLSSLQSLIQDIKIHLYSRRGFVCIRGFPVERLGDEVSSIFWGVGLLLGIPLPQNRAGDRIDVVMDTGIATVRGSKTNRQLLYHTDFANTIPDVFGLLAVRKAKSGGESQLASGHAVYNALLRECPVCLDRLHDEYYFDRSEDVQSDEEPIFKAPIFRETNGKVAVLYNRARIHRGHRQMGLPVDAKDREALDCFDRLLASDEHTLSRVLEPGDALFVNNSVVLHNRTAFVDYEDPGRKRQLLRLWLRCAG